MNELSFKVARGFIELSDGNFMREEEPRQCEGRKCMNDGMTHLALKTASRFTRRSIRLRSSHDTVEK